MQIYSWTALGLSRVGRRDRGIQVERGTFHPHVCKLDVYADSGWAGAADRHSHANMFTECEHGPFVSSSRKQKVLAPGSGEAEFCSLASGIAQGLPFDRGDGNLQLSKK